MLIDALPACWRWRVQQCPDTSSSLLSCCRFSKVLGRVTSKNVMELKLLGLKPEDVGSHSCRKGSATYASSGTTACPSSAAVNLRAGWSFPGVEGTYKRFDGAGDQHVGRTVALLPVTSSQFMTLAPFFGRHSAEAAAVGDVGALITAAIETGFGAHLPASLMAVAEHALASVLFHYEHLVAVLPAQHRLFGNPLLHNEARRQQLQRLVICTTGNSPVAQREMRIVTGP